jgi:cell division protease FtsH
MARKTVTEWGMNERIGFVYYGDDENRQNMWLDLPGGHDYSPHTAQAIDEEVKRVMDEAYADAQRILDENRDKLEAIARALLKYETLDASEVHALIRGETLHRPTLTDLLDADHAATPPPAVPKAKPVTLPEPNLGSGPLPQPG